MRGQAGREKGERRVRKVTGQDVDRVRSYSIRSGQVRLDRVVIVSHLGVVDAVLAL